MVIELELSVDACDSLYSYALMCAHRLWRVTAYRYPFISELNNGLTDVEQERSGTIRERLVL
jgi:hypothetical protein